MTDAAKPTKAPGNTAVATPKHGDHDKIQLPSLRADGSLDQLAPEFIGDPDTTREAVREQYRQQAVSSVDEAVRAPLAEDAPPQDVQDPEIKAVEEAHAKAAKDAEAAADKTVDALFKS